jgi:rhodanese-related sulfurtransferase
LTGEKAMRWKQFLMPVNSINPQELRAFMEEYNEGAYTLLDVRQPGEYEKERIPGAKLIPLPELTGRLGEIDPEKPVIAY